MKFSELDLHPSLFAGIERLGFADCTPIQEQTMPHVLEGRDVAGLAQTGTGKTAAFLLPLMERIVRSRQNPDQLSDAEKAMREKRAFPDWRSNQFVLVLVPTRELAEQVFENAQKLKGDSELRAVSIYGGVAYDKQKEGLRQGVEFVIATPGRLLDLHKEHLLDLKQVRAIVFDEADRMFDMGFKDDMKFILQRVPKERQFLVFSATLNLDVLNTAYQFGANPVEVNVSRDQAKAENVDDKIYHVGQDEKPGHLLSILRLQKPRQAIIFSNFKMNVPRITQFLNENGLPAVGISSLLTQSQRNRVMEQFKGASDHNILVATDVAARGLDIKGVDLVVNFELPDDPENYVHRIGRTGRAGAKGLAFSLVSDRDVDALSRVETYLKHKLDTSFLEEGELVKDFKSMPSDRDSYGERRPRPQGGGGPGGDKRGRGEGRRPRGGDRDGGRRDGRPQEQAAVGGGEGRAPHPRGEQRQRRPEGPRSEQPQQRAGGRREHESRGEQQRRPQQQQRQGSHGGPRAEARGNGHAHHGQGPQPRGKHSQPQPRHGQRRHDGAHGQKHVTPKATPPPKSLGAKVSGFFKRLFGG